MKKYLLLVPVLLLAAACQKKTATPPTTGNPPPVDYSTKYELTAQDSGQTFTYNLTTRFGLELDKNLYPQKELKVSCAPPDLLGSISNIPAVPAPLYAVRYETTAPGNCTIRDKNFFVNIVIE